MSRLAGLTVFAVLLLAGSLALAADPVGTWVFDRDAFRAEMHRIMGAELGELPPEERQQYEQMIDHSIDNMFLGTMELRPDGTALLQDDEGDPLRGRWSRTGDAIQLDFEDDPPVMGTLEGDVLRLKIEEEEEAGQAEPMEVILRRQ